MSSVCVITARGGSKRIPRKNIKEFYGKPILSYSIEAALGSELFDEVMVSTDDKEIARIAIKYGAKVPFMRSEKNSGDFATTTDVLAEVIDEYEKLNRKFNYLCCIYPTAPFLTPEKIQKAFLLMCEKKAYGIVPVVRFSYPPQRCFIINEGKLIYKWPENIQKRSQDLQQYYHDAGQFYFWQVDKFKEGKMSNIIPYIMDEIEVQDIDNLEDWQIAEIKYQILMSNKK